MGRNKVTYPKLNKNYKKTPGGYEISRNGVPLDKNGKNILRGDNFNYNRF